MTVKGLIENLLEMPMDSEVNVAVQNEEGEFVYYNTTIPVFTKDIIQQILRLLLKANLILKVERMVLIDGNYNTCTV